MKIYAIRGNEIKKHTVVAAVVGGIAMVYIGISSGNYLVTLVGLILFLTLIIKRPVYIDEIGLNQVTDFRLFKSIDLWKFSEMGEINWLRLEEENKINIYFEKRGMPKMYEFLPEELDEILSMAMKQNLEIIIKEVKQS